VILAALTATLFALPTAAFAFRLRGGYFAIATWVIAEVYRLLVINTSELGSGNGVTITAAAEVERATREDATYWLALGTGVGAVVLVYMILRSRLGLGLTAIRDNEEGAESLGVNVLRAKIVVYIVAAFGCALAGAVIYFSLLRVQPNAAFSINWTAYMIFIVVIGGIGTIEGPIIGTAVFFVMRELLADYGVWYLVALGGTAVVIMLWSPRGLWSLVARRYDLSLFPVQRRLRIARTPAGAEAGAPGGGTT
jgi:branched-chain amino acid transport system permease protein